MFLTSVTSRAEPPAGAPPDIKSLASPLLFGPLFNWALYGVLCVQIYVYSYNFPKDPRSVKFIAYFLFLLETVQTALTGADVYYWFIDGYGDVEHLANSHFSPIDIPIMTAATSLIVQGYFCYRIWIMNKRSSWICWIIVVCALTQSAGAMWAGITSFIAKKYAVSRAAVYLWSIPSAMADILIAVAMTLLLKRASGKYSNFVLIRLVRLTIETNTLTASVAVATLVLYVAFPNQVYYAYTLEIIGKLYANTLLASLNNRIYFRDHKLSERHDSMGFSNVTAATSLQIAGSGQRSRATTDDSFQLRTITQTVELDKNSDDASINWSLSRPRKDHLLPELIGDTLPPRKEVAYGI